jgi:hypothetical protein
MKYYVNVPMEESLEFPDLCPFSGKPSPSGTVRLKRTSNSFVLPIPGGVRNSYSTTRLRIPADGSIAMLALGLEISMWLCILGGVAFVVFAASQSGPEHMGALCAMPIGLVLAALCRLARFWVLRKLRINSASDDWVELKFASETYARRFSELNRLAVDAR